MEILIKGIFISCLCLTGYGFSPLEFSKKYKPNPHFSFHYFKDKDAFDDRLKVFGFIESSELTQSEVDSLSQRKTKNVLKVRLEIDTLRNYKNISLSSYWFFQKEDLFLKDKETFLQEEFENEEFYGIIFKNIEVKSTLVLFVFKNQKEEFKKNLQRLEEKICLK